MRDWRDQKQPALCFPNVQAAFLCFSLVETQLSYRNFIEATLSDDLHPQRIHNQLKRIRNKGGMTVEAFRSELSKQVERARAGSKNFRMAEKFGLVSVNQINVVFYFEKQNGQKKEY